MEEAPQPGTVIVLNGASSAGKSSIAKELQTLLDGCWLHVGVDHFLAMWPQKYFAIDPSPEEIARQGLYRTTRQDEDAICVDLNAGHLGQALHRSRHRSVAVLAAQGLNIIGDEVLLTREELDEYVAVLSTTTVLFVGVRLPFEVLLQRERDCGNRMVGLARGHHAQVHAHALYDLEVDTSLMSAAQCAVRIKECIEHGPAPDAFARLRAR